MAADSVARGLALAALGQYNKLIKVKQWSVDKTTPIPWGTGYTKIDKGTKVEYTWKDGEGVSHTTGFNVYNGNSIWKYELDTTKGYIDPKDPTKHLGYDAKWVYFKITFSDGDYQELKQPVAQFTFKKIIWSWNPHKGILPPVEEAEDNAIYFLEQGDPLDPEKGSGVYKLYVRTFNEDTHTYEWTNIGSTEFDLTGYQKKIDDLIKYTTKNYDPETIPVSETAKNVVGSANQALAAIGPATTDGTTPHLDLTGDITNLGLVTQILNTLDASFAKRSDVITALNEHEKELALAYDYGKQKILGLGVYDGEPVGATDPHTGHNQNIANILKEIGDMSKLEYIPISDDNPYKGITGKEVDAYCWELDNYRWTLVDAINAAEEKERIKKLEASETDKTKYIRQYQHQRADDKTGTYRPVEESDKISISRDEIKPRTNASINAYKTYDLYEEGTTYDPEIEGAVTSKTDKFEITDIDKQLIKVVDGIYYLNSTLSLYTSYTSVAPSISGRSMAVPTSIKLQYPNTREIRIQIGDETTKYTPALGDWIEVTYEGRELNPYGKVDVPHLKVHKVTPIDDEWWEEDVVLDAAGWILPSGGTKYTHEYKMARILSEEATAGPTIISGPSHLSILNFTKGSRVIHFETTEVPPPTGDVTARIRYQIPSEILAKYYLEYEGQNYDLELCGDEIDILKNGLLEDVTVEECTVPDVPIPGLVPGDKYIDFSFMLASGALKHAYLRVKDLLDPYRGYKAIRITYITDPTQPDYKQNRVELVINEAKNDRTRPAGSTTPVHPTLIQDTSGLYISDADEETYGAVEFAKRTYPTDPDKTKDEVLTPLTTYIKVVKPYDLLDFVRLSESVDPSLKYIYEKDTTTHEHINKTMIDAFNEIASMKIGTERIQDPSSTASEKEKKMFIEAYRLFTTPDSTTRHYLGDKVYNYKEIVITETLKTDNPPTTLYPDQLNEYTMFYLSKKEEANLPGLYVYTGGKFVRVSGEPIIDSDVPLTDIPTTEIQNSYFYRTYDESTVMARYALKQEAIIAGYTLDEQGLHIPGAADPVVLTEDNFNTYYGPEATKPITDDTHGPLYKVLNGTTVSYLYNFNKSHISLSFRDTKTDKWVDIISKYKVVNTFVDKSVDPHTVLPGNEWEIYILLAEDNGYEPGIYIWDRTDYVSVSSQSKAIVDTDALPVAPQIKENVFYRTHDDTVIDGRYDLTDYAIKEGYVLSPTGIKKGSDPETSWAAVKADWANWTTAQAPATEPRIDPALNPKGPIFMITKDGVQSLYYNFNTSPVTLQFHDPETNTWVDMISKYKAVNTFDGVVGEEWQIYVLLNNSGDYKKGVYIWDRNNFVTISSDSEAIIDVEELPTLKIEEKSFYRTHDDTVIRNRYKLTDGAIAEGYTLTPGGIKLGTITTSWDDVFDQFDDWTKPETGKDYARIIEDKIHGSIYRINNDPAMADVLVYNYNISPVSLQFHDLTTNDWVEMISKYEAVNSFYNTDRTLKIGKEWQVYMLLNDDIDPTTGAVLYKRGIYIWDRAAEGATQSGDYIAVSSITDCIIVVDSLPTLNINSRAVYELRTTNTLPTTECYKIAATEPATTTLDIYGLHYEDATVTPPEMKTVCFADLFLNWATYSTRFELDGATPTTGTIWKISDGTNTEFRWSDTKPELIPEKRTQFYVYNEDTSTWKLLADDNNSINGVYNHNEGRQTSESLEIIWEGSKIEYEALTKINPSTLYLVHNGEGKGPTISYNTLDDRPMINHVLLQGDTTLQELGLSAFLFKGTVATIPELPSTGNEQGDLYYVSTPKEFYAWNGINWYLAGTDLADFSKYQLKEDLTLKTTAKEVVPAINEIFDNMAIPEALTVTCTPATGSQDIAKGWYTATTKEIRFSIIVKDLNISEEKENYTLGTISFGAASGTLTPAFKQAVASCDLDGKVSTNIFIAPDGTIKANIYMGHHSLKETELLPIENIHSYYTEGFTLNQLSISGTIFCN